MALSYSLLPGCNFFPSPKQLLKYYLSGKNRCGSEPENGFDFIKELDFYNCEPFHLPDVTCYRFGTKGRKMHWFFYVVKGVRERKGGRRRAKSGYWKPVGQAVDVTDGVAREVLGTRAGFRFYLGMSPKTAVRTEWFMHEYALLQGVKASFVLCRVFVKSFAASSVSEKIVSSCAEESVSAVRHIGIQHDGSLSPNVEAKLQQDHSVDGNSDASGYPLRPNSELQVPAFARHLAAAGFQSLPSIPSSKPAVSQLLSIMEGDFMELDDLDVIL